MYTNKACSNKRNRENEYNCGEFKPKTVFAPRWDLYTMNIDYDRNYYSYSSFKHLTINYKNMKIIERERRLKYRDNQNNKR